jgi:hypothetical protein
VLFHYLRSRIDRAMRRVLITLPLSVIVCAGIIVLGVAASIIYAIIAYMMAMSSFKLIDQIPDHILRWMGTSVKSFGEIEKDHAENLVQYSFMGTQMISGQLNKGLHSLMKRNG